MTPRRRGSEATVLECTDHILPGMDWETSKMVHKVFQKQGLTFKPGVLVTRARTSHAHPTLAEVIKEAAFAVDGRAIHM